MTHSISFRWLLAVIIPAVIGCSGVAGPHLDRKERQEGVRIIHLEGYGCNMLHLKDTSSLHLGWYRRTVVFEDDSSLDEDYPAKRFSVFGILPDGLPLHHSVVDLGATATWEPCFRGISLGFQSRSLSRLPLDRSLILEATQTAGNSLQSQFSLHRLP